MRETLFEPLELPISNDSGDILGAVREIASLINASNDYHGLLNRIVHAVCHHLVWSRCGISIIDRTSAISRSVAFHDQFAVDDPGTVASWDLAVSPTLRVVEDRKPLVIVDAASDRRFPKYAAFAKHLGLQTAVYLPLSSTDLEGFELVLNVSSRDNISVTDADLEELRTICHLFSIAVEKLKLFQAEQRITGRLRELIDHNSKLMEKVISGCALDEAVDHIAGHLQHPLVVYDRISDSCRWSGVPEPLSELAGAEQQTALESISTQMKSLVEWGLAQEDETLSVTVGGTLIELQAIIHPLLINTQVMGGLIVFPRADGMGEIQRLAALCAQFAVSTHLMRIYANWTEQNTAAAAFFTHLFGGEWQTLHQVESMAESAGLDFIESAQFLAVDLSALVKEKAIVQRFVEVSTHQIMPSATVFINNSILFIYCPSPGRHSAELIQRLSHEVEKIIEWRTDKSVGMTLSPICNELGDYRSVRSHCMQVLRLARMFGRTGLVASSDFGSFAVLVSALGDEAVERFFEETLRPIMEHDRAKKSSLLLCSQAFLKHGCKYQAAADAMSINVSTLRYRLRRMRELFGFDLENNEDDRFAILLALRINSLRN